MWRKSSLIFLLLLVCAADTQIYRTIDSNAVKYPTEDDIVFPNEKREVGTQHSKPSLSQLFKDSERPLSPLLTASASILSETRKTLNFVQYQLKKIEQKINDYLSKRENDRQESLRSRNYPPPPMPGDPFPPPPDGPMPRYSNGSQRLCEIKYSEYVQRIYPGDVDTVADANDSDFDGRVLAKPAEYPHMAAIGFRNDNGETEYKCGGSLISEKFVLTAAHCTSINSMMPTKVRIGDLNLMVDEYYVEPQTRRIQRIYNHPSYNSNLYYNDISLIEMDQNIELTVYVRPIRLWTYADLPTSIAFAMGYGATDLAKGATHRLTDMNLTIVPNEECNNELPALTETPRGVVSSQVCAHDYVLNRDTCQGDSGGPLQVNLPGRRRKNLIHYHLIGITSYGVLCRSAYPSVYTRVSSFLDWIESIVWSAHDNL